MIQVAEIYEYSVFYIFYLMYFRCINALKVCVIQLRACMWHLFGALTLLMESISTCF